MKITADKFWYAWLKVTAVLTTLFGIKLVLYYKLMVIEPFNRFISNIFNLTPEISKLLTPLQGWLFGVQGFVMAIWGVIVLYLIIYPLQRKQNWSWNVITISLIVWYLTGTIISAKAGVNFIVTVNSILFFQFIAPLMFLRNSMLKLHPNEIG